MTTMAEQYDAMNEARFDATNADDYRSAQIAMTAFRNANISKRRPAGFDRHLTYFADKSVYDGAHGLIVVTASN